MHRHASSAIRRAAPSLLAAVLACASAGAHALERTGRIDRVALDEQRIVINDAQYRLGQWTRVEAAGGTARAGLAALAPGAWVRYRVDGEGPGRIGRVREIRLLAGPPRPSAE